MARRIRSIKPEVLDSETAAFLSDAAWRLWVSMWTLSDDEGLLGAPTTRLAAQVFWMRHTPAEVDQLLGELEVSGLVERYECNEKIYARISGFSEHQRIDKPTQSRLPKPHEGKPVGRIREASRGVAKGRVGLDLDLDLEGIGSGSGPFSPAMPDEVKQQSLGIGDKPCGVVKPKPTRKKAAKPEVIAVLDEYQRLWLERYRPEDGQPPHTSDADFGQAARLVRLYGVEKAIGYVRVYVADETAFVVDSGHAFSLITKRLTSYQAGVAPNGAGRSRRHIAPSEGPSESCEQSKELR